MCGIAGSVDFEIEWDTVIGTVRHRGPDGSGQTFQKVCGKEVWLAHTRLSILDLSPAGAQPMQSRDGRWWLTFNGEIYNHLQLREKMAGPFRGHSDTETLVELVAAFGMDRALIMLNGMFAFAALDTREGLLYLARDPFGVKPVYYVEHGGRFAFASEIRALKAMGEAREVDPQGVQQFLALRYTPSPRTMWKNIWRLPPGYVLKLELDGFKSGTFRYVKPAKKDFSGSIEEAVEAYRDALQSAVRRQLLSDVPVGILLSGGIDSALIAAMAKQEGHELPAFTVGFGGRHEECEIDDAAETADILGLPFHAIDVTPDQLQEALPAIVNSIEEPLGTTSIMPMWYLVQRARRDVTVVLTGQGTDEPWGGYRRYQVEMVRHKLPTVFWELVSRSARLFSLPEVVERSLRTLQESDPARRILEASALFSSDGRRRLTGDVSDGGALQSIAGWLQWLDNTGCPAEENAMRLDTRMNLADDLLLYGDKLSMAFSLEARVPMLDTDLVNLVESFPLEYRISLNRNKIVHKIMAEKYLPQKIVHRQKKGFQVPFAQWSRGPWRAFVESLLLDPHAGHFSFLCREGVEHVWQAHLSGKSDSRQVFSLFMLALWWVAQE